MVVKNKGSKEYSPKIVTSNLTNSGIVLVTHKLNLSHGSKHIHYNSNSKTFSKTNQEIFNGVIKTTNDSIIEKHTNAVTSDLQQPKTATILVSKSKTKSGLPLLLKHFK